MGGGERGQHIMLAIFCGITLEFHCGSHITLESGFFVVGGFFFSPLNGFHCVFSESDMENC